MVRGHDSPALTPVRAAGADGRLELHAASLTCLQGGRALFQDLGFTLGAGEVLEIRGPNGSGKTTLLRVLAGLLRPEAGTVYWCGHPIEAVRMDYLRALVFLGHTDGVKGGLTVRENFLLAQALRGGNGPRELSLQRLGLGDLADVPVRRLSAGQRRRVGLARLLIGGAALWMLDEPFTALDAGASQAVSDMIARHLADGGLLVYTSHQSIPIAAARALRVEL